MVASATILDSPGGLRKRAVVGLKQGDIDHPHHLIARSARLEAAYACGFLNAWSEESFKAISTIDLLSHLTQVPLSDAIGALQKATEKWGASNYIARKIAYVKEFTDVNGHDQSALDEIDAMLEHNEHPLLQYSALEHVIDRIPLFSLARRHTNIFQDSVSGDFRKIHDLNNLVATPFSTSDCADFLLRGVESSLIDAVLSVLIIVNLGDRFPSVVEAIRRNLSPDIWARILGVHEALSVADLPNLFEGTSAAEQVSGRKVAEEEDRSLSLYRRSILFLEYPQLCAYRNDLDRVIGHRLVAPLLPEIRTWNAENFYRRDILRREDGEFQIELHGRENVRLDTFYRTYLFLRFIQDPLNLSSLDSADIQYIFDKTMRLENLLLERELKTMHLNASDEARALISVLALALYRSKSSDPDVDFDFRQHLENFIIENYAGDIPSFIAHLAPSSPEVASYIASSLDEVTLQKMYSIVDSPGVAESTRRSVLMTIGQLLNRIEYIVEAEGIETRSKVAKLKDYFDASRMFVDSIAMKKWLSSHPSAYTEQYKELLPKIVARLSKLRNVKTSSGGEATIDLLELTLTDEYLVEKIATEAFGEFCTNNEFGIESFLGRRIRHNTLQGVMTSSVDAVLRRTEYQPVIVGTPFGAALSSWESSYKIFIERMRRELLQFRSESKPNALFSAVLDKSDPATKTNLQQLVQTLRLSGAEMLHDLVIAFCWSQITPQLEFASRHIRVTLAQDVGQMLDQALQRFNGPEEQKIKSALGESIASVFAQVASWFQTPQTGFVAASIVEICNIIDIEHNRPASTTIVSGDLRSKKYYGISVHRIYDCLAVLLQNAFKHGQKGAEVKVQVVGTPLQGTSLHTLEVSVFSKLPVEDAGDCVARVDAAVTSSETSTDMVTEGYSGIKKVKFITRLNEGLPTASYNVSGDEIEIRFRLKAEVASGEKPYEENSFDRG